MRADKLLYVITILFVPLLAQAANFTGDAEICRLAEEARVRSAEFWIGRRLPDWDRPCPISVVADGNASRTRHQSDGRKTYPIDIVIVANHSNRLEDNIPHEVDHAVRATILNKRLPRWLDEGAACYFETKAEKQRRYASIASGELQHSAWNMLHLKEYPNDAEMTNALYTESPVIVEWMLEMRGPKDVLLAMKHELDSDAKWQLYVGESKERSRRRFEEWFAAKVDSIPTEPVESVRPYVEVLVAGDFPCVPCENWKAFAATTREGRLFDYRVRKISREEWERTGVSVPQFKVGDKVFVFSEGDDWTDVEKWALRELGLKNEPVEGWGGITSEDIEQAEPELVAFGWPPHPQQYKRNIPPVQQPQVPPPPQETQPGITLSNEAVGALIDKLDPAPKPKEPDPEINWEGVVIAVAASNDVPAVAKAIEGPAKRALQRLTQGKAILRIIAERTNPQQFASYEATLGLDIDRIHVSVLIPETEHSLPVDFLIQKLEIRLSGVIENFSQQKLKDIPVEPIFERLDGDKYSAVWDDAFEADSSREKPQTGLIGFLSGAVGLILGRLGVNGSLSWLFGWAMRKVHRNTPVETVLPVPQRKKATRKRGRS